MNATPTMLRREARRRHVILAASEVFGNRGYHGTSMDEVSVRAGFTKPMLYELFSGKLELYLTVLQSHIDALVRGVRHALASGDNHQRVHAAVQAIFDFADEDPAGLRLIFESGVSNEPSVEWRVRNAIAECVGCISDAVIDDSGLDPHRARLLAVGLVGASQMAAREWLDSGRPITKRAAVEITVALCWDGLSRVPLHSDD
ncbi:TetR/AcrR family transcriptional regulator [Nocardia sp. NPDC060220]|uniref:TetR/AcrR family transcriptional regulator n=1 Tax=Nocardia sp. NPDC060220 TaxID=3347076 RepID=UPI00365CACB3